MASPADPPLTGRVFGDYRLLAPLGQGGMGVVYAAEDRRLRRTVAIKVLPADSHHDARAQERLLREARAAASLDHPSICAIYDVGEADGQAFIVMQHIAGETLSARLARGPMDVRTALDVAGQVTDALAHAHDRGLVHRDIKPQNVMVPMQGPVKVLDFGIAKITRPVPDETDTVSGFMTAEGGVCRHRPVHVPRTDPGRASRRPDRHLQLGNRPSRNADWTSPVPRIYSC